MSANLIDAARAGDLDRCHALLASASPGERVGALHAAAHAGHLAVLERLIPSIEGRLYVIQALVPAVRGGRFDCIRHLLTIGAKPGYEVGGRTAEGEAAAQGSLELLRAIVWGRTAAGQEFERKIDWDPRYPMPVPADEGAAPAAADGYSPLLNAIRGGHLDAVRFLIEREVDVNRASLIGRNPIEVAEALGQAEIVALLRDHGAVALDRESLDLAAAAGYGFVDRFDALFDQASEQDKRVAFSMAAQGGVASLLHRLAPFADPKDFVDALGLAAARGHLDAIRALLSLGADVNGQTRTIGRTALGSAAARGQLAAAELLLRNGAKPDKASKGDRVPPLHDAIQAGHVGLVELLLSAGASPNKVEADGTTTIACARDSARAQDIVPLVEAAGGRPDLRKQLLKQLEAALKADKRKAYAPDTVLGIPPEHAGPRGSRYGGQPWLDPEHPRPTGAAGPLPLAVQIDLAAHPDPKLARPGLLQVFHDPDAAGDARLVARVSPAEGEHRDDDGPELPARAIVGWSRAKRDFPSVPEDPARSEVALDDEQLGLLRQLNLAGDKLGGWPDWLQDPIAPTCPECGKAQILLVQIEGGRHVGIDLGDAGVGYVFWCPAHPARVRACVQAY